MQRGAVCHRTLHALGPAALLAALLACHAGGAAEAATLAQAIPQAVPQPAPQQVLGVRAGKHPGFGRIVFDWPGLVDYRVRKKGRRIGIEFDGAAVVDVSALPLELPERIVSASARSTRGGLHVALVIAQNARIRHFRDGTRIVVDVLLWTTRPPRHPRPAAKRPPSDGPAARRTPAKSAPSAPLTRSADSAPAVKIVPRTKRSPQGTGGLVSVDVAQDGGAMVFRFNWRKEVAAAVYRRQGNLWMFFNEAARVDLGGIRYKGSKLVEDVKQYPMRDAALIRLAVPAEIPVSVGRDGPNWTLRVGNSGKAEGGIGAIEARTETDGDGRSQVVLPVAGARKRFKLTDPEVGDALEVVPVAKVGFGVRQRRRFIDFELFESYQGVAIRPIADSLAVQADDKGIVISRPGGLQLSSADDIERQNKRTDADRPLGNIAAWRQGPSSEYQALKRKANERVAQQPKNKRFAVRVDLAKFYLSHGMAAEAIGVLRIIEHEQPAASRNPHVRALRGAAHYLLHHFGDATAAFADMRLREERTVWPWLGGIAAAKGDWRTAYDRFQGTDSVIARHPKWLAAHFLALSIEASLAVGDLAKAKKQLAIATQMGGTDKQRAFIEFLRAVRLQKAGKTEEALAIWNRQVASPHRRIRARATFAQVETLLATKKIKTDKAIDKLQALTFAWRGDVFEFDLLQRLGDLYASKKDYRNALLQYRKAASYFEKVRGSQVIAHKMSDTFKKLYLEGAADELPPVTALAMFQEFRELTPSGKTGDDMIRRLADRLTKVDLLTEAADLLAHQIQFRLKGVDKAKVAARLALIHLLNHKPQDALKALRDSAHPQVPKDLARQRRLLEARALSEVGRAKEALAVLGDDSSEDARMLRLGILWRDSRWAEAAALIEKSMQGRKLAPDDDEATRTVLRWAVALALANDDAGLKRLSKRYGTVMGKSRRAKSFLAIVGKKPESVNDFKSLVAQAGDLDTFRNFLSSYRERVRNTRLSGIN